ncbi:MAG: energy-coupling factor transporter ATPase [Culicoidibacterales bacterium]
MQQITLKGVSHTYSDGYHETPALESVDLTVMAGERLAIVGHTGSGKSTLVQHLNALLQPHSGTVEAFGLTITQDAKKNRKLGLTKLRQKVGLVFQYPEYQLFAETVLEDIMYGPLNFGASREDAETKAYEMMEVVGLPKTLADRYPLALSGGQMRRVAVAGILAMNPDVLVLDEPTVGLDPCGQKEMMQLFMELHETLNKTLIIVTHDMDVVANYAQRLIVMQSKKKVFDGQPHQFFQKRELVDACKMELPHTVELVQSLRQQGIELDEGILTFEEVIAALIEEEDAV